MNRFRNVLVAAAPGRLDAATLGLAADLPGVSGLTVLDVMAPLPAFRRKVDVEGRTVDLEAALTEDRHAAIRELVARVLPGLDVDVVVVSGEPFVEVIRRVIAKGHDLVVVGWPERQEDDESLPTGIMQLLRKCPIPVWVARPSRARNLRVLALVDPDPDDPVRDGLNDRVLDLARSLREWRNGDLHVAHAWSLAGESTFRSSPYVGMPDAMVDAMVRSVEGAHQERLIRSLERHGLGGGATQVHMPEGEAGIVLPRLARRLSIGLIVMGTVGRTGLSGLFMGNTAETILRRVDCSVLAVKPDGFESPIKLRRGTG